MIAVRISPDLRMTVVGSPSYFADRKRRGHLRIRRTTTVSTCVCPPMAGASTLGVREERTEAERLVEGQLVFNERRPSPGRSAKGLGLAYLTEGHVQPYFQAPTC